MGPGGRSSEGALREPRDRSRALDVSVVVPCYNSESHIRSCLDALCAQTYPSGRYEVVLANNGSTDRSAELARQYPVKLVESSKRGSYSARNAGVLASRGALLAFTDSDCEVSPTWLERIVAAMADPGLAILLGARRFARETPILSTLADYEIEKARYVFSQDDASLYYGYTNNLAVRRAVFERAGPFVEIQRGADVVFVTRTVETFGCASVRFDPRMEVRHLEIDRWHDWHGKMFLYGKSYRRYHRLTRTRPLSYPSRFEILRRTADRNGYSLLRKAFLLASGGAATVAYGLGQLFGGQPIEPDQPPPR